MASRQLAFADEAHEKIRRGVDALARAVEMDERIAKLAGGVAL